MPESFQAAATRDREADRQEMLRRTAAARPPAPGSSQATPQPGPSHRGQPQTNSRLPCNPAVDFGMPTRQLPPYPTQGYSTPALPQAPCTPGLPAPPKAQASKPSGTATCYQTERRRFRTSASKICVIRCGLPLRLIETNLYLITAGIVLAINY